MNTILKWKSTDKDYGYGTMLKWRSEYLVCNVPESNICIAFSIDGLNMVNESRIDYIFVIHVMRTTKVVKDVKNSPWDDQDDPKLVTIMRAKEILRSYEYMVCTMNRPANIDPQSVHHLFLNLFAMDTLQSLFANIWPVIRRQEDAEKLVYDYLDAATKPMKFMGDSLPFCELTCNYVPVDHAKRYIQDRPDDVDGNMDDEDLEPEEWDAEDDIESVYSDYYSISSIQDILNDVVDKCEKFQYEYRKFSETMFKLPATGE